MNWIFFLLHSKPFLFVSIWYFLILLKTLNVLTTVSFYPIHRVPSRSAQGKDCKAKDTITRATKSTNASYLTWMDSKIYCFYIFMMNTYLFSSLNSALPHFNVLVPTNNVTIDLYIFLTFPKSWMYYQFPFILIVFLCLSL